MAHGGFLRDHSDNPELASHMMHDYTQAQLDPQTCSGPPQYMIKLVHLGKRAVGLRLKCFLVIMDVNSSQFSSLM